MKPASWVAVLLAGCVLVLTPLAYGTPPDPGWISGFWDDGDYDDVVCLVTSSAGTLTVHGSDASSAVVVGLPIERDPGTHLAARPSTAPTRAPPAA